MQYILFYDWKQPSLPFGLERAEKLWEEKDEFPNDLNLITTVFVEQTK